VSLLVDDRELLRRFRRGERAALRQVFTHYAPRIAAMLRRGFGFQAGGRRVQFQGYRDTFDLEDGLQEIFRRAFSDNARTAYDGLRPYKMYLGAIARNVVINTYVANARRLERYGFEEIETAPDDGEWTAADDFLGGEDEPTGKPERDAETRELRALVESFRDGLAEREREVFALRFDECLSHAEITERCGLSPSKIKTAEARIRTQLLRYLHKHGYLASYSRRSRTTGGSGGLQGEKT
jgi:RNA polymerase sigma-70 factor (ECF subfamily)